MATAINDAIKPEYQAYDVSGMLVYGFLSLPFRHQYDIAKYFHVFDSATHYLSATDEALYSAIFEAVRKSGRYHDLWEQVASRCTEPMQFAENPFLKTKDIDKNTV